MVAGIGDTTYGCPGMYLLDPADGNMDLGFETDCNEAMILTKY